MAEVTQMPQGKTGERERELVPFSVDYICDSCGRGLMEHTGETLTSYPPQYPHRCANCKTVKNFHCVYPKIIYKDKESL